MIIFEKIRYKNFLSTGNAFTEIELNKTKNTCMIGVNGAGKSTILDALTFVLFGKSYRKINKPQLINSINTSNCVVEIEFTIGKKKYKIIRGLKPSIFEIYCDGNLINQDASSKDYQEVLEKGILKLNYKSFTQIVILGSSSFVPFMQLSAADRRSIIEELLDIQIFSSMNVLVKQKLSSFKEATTKLKYEMELTAEKIKLQKQNIDDHKKHNDDEIEKKQSDIVEAQKEIDRLTNDIDLIQKHMAVLQTKITAKDSIKTKTTKLVQIEAKLESSNKKLKKDIEFFQNHDNCPTCRQTIDEAFKETQITQKKEKLNEIQTANQKLTEEIESLNNKMEKIAEISKHIVNHNSEVVSHLSVIKSTNDYISKVQKEISALMTKKDGLEADNGKLNELKAQLTDQIKEQERLSKEKHYYDYAATLLKDTGIKTKIVKQYLPIMNKLINKYLSAMDFFVNFNINENFEETIKSRHRDDFSYDSFSEGEKQKIDIALLLTWRQIAKIKNSTNTNLLIMDEIFDASLDSKSVDLLMSLLKQLPENTNVFVISHKGDALFDKFESIIKFQKKNNFSEVIK